MDVGVRCRLPQERANTPPFKPKPRPLQPPDGGRGQRSLGSPPSDGLENGRGAKTWSSSGSGPRGWRTRRYHHHAGLRRLLSLSRVLSVASDTAKCTPRASSSRPHRQRSAACQCVSGVVYYVAFSLSQVSGCIRQRPPLLTKNDTTASSECTAARRRLLTSHQARQVPPPAGRGRA